MNDLNPSAQPVWNLPELLVRVDHDQELLRDLLNIFKEDFPRTMASLRSAVAAADCNNAASLSHALKGMLSNLAATNASVAAAELERLAKAQDKSGLSSALGCLEREASWLVPEIEAYIAEVRA
jgi:two-component system, sensor histidine kinase and response regulator